MARSVAGQAIGASVATSGPLEDLARVASFVAGASACFRDRAGRVLGEAGALAAATYALEGAPEDRQVVVADATLDRRFASHPHVVGSPSIRFWARLPVRGPSGAVAGWLELADMVPRLLPEDRLAALAALVRQAASAFAPPELGWREAIFRVPAPVFLVRVEEGAFPVVRFLDANPSARRITTPQTTERFGGTVDELFPWAREHDVTARCIRAARSGEPMEFELPITLGTGRVAWFRVRLFPLPEGHLGVLVEDFTDRAEAQRRKDDFVAVLAHELRTPLASARGALGLLQGGVAGPLPEHAARLVSMAEESTGRLGRILSDLLDLERLRAGLLPLRSEPVGVVDLVSAATGASAAAARAAGVRIVTRIETEGGVLGDRERLAQAITNLLSNAVRSSPSGGAVRVRLWCPDPSRLRLDVSDDGREVAPGEAERLFLPYHTSAPGELRGRGGLGLAISRFVVEGHGGSIGVESNAERGATFWIELPVLAVGPG